MRPRAWRSSSTVSSRVVGLYMKSGPILSAITDTVVPMITNPDLMRLFVEERREELRRDMERSRRAVRPRDAGEKRGPRPEAVVGPLRQSGKEAQARGHRRTV